MKLFVGKETRQGICAGAVCGLIFCLTNASAPVIYAMITVVGSVICLANDGWFNRVLSARRRRRP